MSDSFEFFADQPTAPSSNCFSIAPSDTQELSAVTKAIYVGEGGDITLRSAKGTADVVFRNVPAGYVLDVRTSQIRETGTTASALVGLA